MSEKIDRKKNDPQQPDPDFPEQEEVDPTEYRNPENIICSPEFRDGCIEED